MIPRLLLLILTLLARPLAASPDMAEVSLIPGWTLPDGTRIAGLRITLAPGWKTYWRSPGDAGIPPLFDWSGSQNLSGVKIHWPVPEVFHQDGMRIVAYKGEVVLPLELTPERSEAGMDVNLQLDFGICHDICVPVSARVQTRLTDAKRRSPLLVAALLDGPQTGRGPMRCTLTPGPDGIDVTLHVPEKRAHAAVVESAGFSGWITEPSVTDRPDGTEIHARMVGAGLVERDALRLTLLISDHGAVEYLGCD